MFKITEVTPELEADVAVGNLVPEGEYNFLIETARISDNKMCNGKFLELTCIPEKVNRKIWKYFNFKHTNKTTENMAKVDLKNLCIALRIEQISNPEELNGKLFSGKISHKKDKNGQLKAEITSYGEYKPLNNEEDIPF